MDDDMEVEYVFEAGGDACGACQSMSGMTSSEPIAGPHDNCSCQCSATAKCDYTYDYESEGTSRTGSPSGEGDYVIGFSVEVTCSNGDTIGGEISIDGHDLPSEYGDGDEWLEGVLQAVDEYAAELAEGCDCEPPNVA